MARHTENTGKISLVTQNITIGAASAQATNAFAANTWEIRIAASGACWVKIDVNPTAAAAAGSFYLPSGQVEYLHVNPGQKIAAIQDGASTGTLSIAECSR